MKRNKETNASKVPSRFSKMKYYSQTMQTFLSHYINLFRDHLHQGFFRRVKTESWFFANTVCCIASMILCMARYLCVLYAEICVDTTAGKIWIQFSSKPYTCTDLSTAWPMVLLDVFQLQHLMHSMYKPLELDIQTFSWLKCSGSILPPVWCYIDIRVLDFY